METELGSWHSPEYVADWVGDDVIADLLSLPRKISVALVADAGNGVRHVVDLGSGHGPYLELFLRSFPEARGTWVDSSQAMLEVAREKLSSYADRVDFVLGDVEQLDELELERADVVVSSRVFHHLSPESLERLYGAIHDLLVPGGFFFNLDHVGPPGDWEQTYRRVRKSFTGPRKRELKPHRHDYPLAPAEDHLAYAAKAGFETPDTPWRAFYTALVAARKAA
jgi:tRNA (cmo5U34)-methyltransferase